MACDAFVSIHIILTTLFRTRERKAYKIIESSKLQYSCLSENKNIQIYLSMIKCPTRRISITDYSDSVVAF